mmetsp:Transcript_568/g.1792  ORF Transcript_568/g.1792 Transcript_568/m.1792 type:complete len:261 (+) Transcript_568:96-878(+)
MLALFNGLHPHHHAPYYPSYYNDPFALAAHPRCGRGGWLHDCRRTSLDLDAAFDSAFDASSLLPAPSPFLLRPRPRSSSSPHAKRARRPDGWASVREGEGGGLVIEADASGVRPGDLHVTVDGRTLTIKGHREENEDGHRSFTSFERSWRLPEHIDADSVAARLVHPHEGGGVLRVEAARRAEPAAPPAPRAIEIAGAAQPKPEIEPEEAPRIEAEGGRGAAGAEGGAAAGGDEVDADVDEEIVCDPEPPSAAAAAAGAQ